MLKQTKTALTDRQLVNDVFKYTHEIWLAGLGAYGEVREQGSRTFASLVKTGTHVEARAIKVAGARIEQVVAETTRRWKDVQGAVERPAKRVLKRFKVASSTDIETLVARIDALKVEVEALATKH
jgi:poly(hydroxyalkanoate) granule-associated protein